MRDFLADIAIPTVAYFISVAVCVSAIIIATALAVDLISNPAEITMEDVQ